MAAFSATRIPRSGEAALQRLDGVGRASGSSAIARVAAIPSSVGMRMSMSTTRA